MLVTSWAFTVLRRCKSADGKRSSGSSCRLRATSKISRPARSSRSSSSSSASASSASLVLWIRDPRSGPFPPVSAGRRTAARGPSPSVRRLTAALRISARTTSSVIRALWAIRSANWSRAAASGIRAATVSIRPEELAAAVVLAEIQPGGGLIEQVLQIRPRTAQSFTILRPALPPDERIGIFALVQHHHVDVEPFGDQQLARSGRRPLAGRVRVVAEHHFRRESPQQLRLLRRERGAARGDDGRRLGLKHLREVEVSLDEHREAQLFESAPSSGSARTASGSSSRSASRANSGTSDRPDRRPSAGRRTRSPTPVSRQIGTIRRLRNRSTTSPLSRCTISPLCSSSPCEKPCASSRPFKPSRAPRREPEAELLDALRRDVPIFQLLARASSSGTGQLLAKVRGRHLVNLQQRFAQGGIPPRVVVSTASDSSGSESAELLREHPHRFLETRPSRAARGT